MAVPNQTIAANRTTDDARRLSESVAMASKGEQSYSGRNSAYQGKVSAMFQPLIADSIQSAEWVSDPAGTVRVADFGCSIGANTIKNVAFIIDSVRQKCKQAGFEPEVWVFFVDLPSNDFNRLFQELVEAVVGKPEEYFIAGAAENFYNRLLPKSFLHIGYSSISLHWLSKIPAVVREKNSPAYSGRNIFAQGSRASRATADAYGQQSRTDLKAFLDARYEELVPGGMLLLVIQTVGNSQARIPLFEDCESAWKELTEERVIDEETSCAFDIPFFCPTLEDVERVLENFSSMFHVNCMKTMSAIEANQISDWKFADVDALSAYVRKATYVGIGPCCEKCVGVDIATKLFDRFQRNVKVVCEKLWSPTGDLEAIKRRLLGGLESSFVSLSKKKQQ